MMMKQKLYTVFIVVSMLIVAACRQDGDNKEMNNNSPEVTTVNETKIEFESDTHDFGTVDAGPVLTHKFRFTNTGDSELIIRNVSASCGCTVPKWSKEPVKPGEQGEIEVHFNTAGRYGGQHKTVTIYANVPGSEVELNFRAEIINPDEE